MKGREGAGRDCRFGTGDIEVEGISHRAGSRVSDVGSFFLDIVHELARKGVFLIRTT